MTLSTSDEEDRRRFGHAYARAARADRPTAEELAEQEAWDGTLSDGLVVERTGPEAPG